jgi:aspartate/methionine/tyrosine aminotransferase
MIQKIWSHRDYTTIAPSILSDHLARIAMEPARRGKIFARTRSILRTNLPPLENWIRSHGDLFDYTPPLAGAIDWMKYKLPIGSIEPVERLRKEHSVLIVAGESVRDGEAHQDWVREPSGVLEGGAGEDP